MKLTNDIFAGNQVLVCGHQGERCSGLENTLTAFRRALSAGVDMIETDVHMTRDGALVLMHDDAVDRQTDGTGLVRDLTLEEISRLNAAARAVFPAAPEPPPTLEALLELVRPYPHVYLNIELKDYPEDGETFACACADRICDTLLAYGVQGRTWINSFSGKLLEYVWRRHGETFFYHGFYPWFILGEMTADPEDFVTIACMQHRFQRPDGTVEKYDDPLCPEDWFKYVTSRGMVALAAPSLQEDRNFDLAFSYGSRLVNADDPARMLRYLRERGLHR